MNRTYTIDQYRALAARLRTAIPDLALTTDIIVGFPGETPEDFELTSAFLREMRYDGAFQFKYSARPDTKAWRWEETVPEEEKARRLERLIAEQHAISGERNDAWIGREIEVLVEGPSRKNLAQLHGKSAQFKTVVMPNDGTPAGTLKKLRVVGSTPITLFGEPLAVTLPTPALVTIG
jgi:tRNA-2-methylthio-N6-dimethylallyladenosine synthase